MTQPGVTDSSGAQSAVALLCGKCRIRYKVLQYRKGYPYQCKRCGEALFPEEHLKDTIATPAPVPPAEKTVRPLLDESLKLRKDIPKQIGRYPIIHEIARGGMGVVHKGKNPEDGSFVAVKMMLPGGMASGEMVQRFKREVRTASQLDHPHIVKIYEQGEHEGNLYFAMEYIEGESLEMAMQRPRPDILLATRTLAKVADAVHHAHGQGVIHRDLKPANIIMDVAGEPHITDFGLAKDVSSESILSVTGEVMGTPAYMSPEQASGKVHEVDARSDVYSIGAILYRLITGHSPYEGSTLTDTLLKILQEEPELPSQVNPRVDPRLDTICMRAMEKDPAHRYQTAAALAEDLRNFRVGHRTIAQHGAAGRSFSKALRRKKGLLKGLGALVAGGLLVWSAIAVLGRSSHLEHMQQLLSSPDAAVRRNTADTLAQEILTARLEEDERAQACSMLVRLLIDPDPEVQKAVLIFLVQAAQRGEAVPVDWGEAAEGLAALAGGKSPPELRLMAMALLPMLPEDSKSLAVEALLVALNDPDPKLRLAAIRVARYLPSRRIYMKLTELMLNDEECRVAAREVLRAYDDEMVLIPFNPGGSVQLGQALRDLSEKLSEARRLREQMMQQLQGGGESELLARIEKLLENPDPAVRLQALNLIRDRLDTPAVVPLLTRALEGNDPVVSAMAARILAEMKHPDGRRALREGLESPELKVRTFCAEALARSGEAGLQENILLWLAQTPEATVKCCLIRALKLLRAKEAYPHLIEALESPEESVRQEALAALRYISGKELGPDPEAWREALAD